MSVFQNVSFIVGHASGNGYDVVIQWEFNSGFDYNCVEVYRKAGGVQGEALAQFRTHSPGHLALYPADLNQLLVVARTVENGATLAKTPYPGSEPLDFDNSVFIWELDVTLPAPAESGPQPRSNKPGNPVITGLEVHDGALVVSWRPTGNSDIDWFGIAIVENGVHLHPAKVKGSKHAYEISPTRAGATYDIGVRAQNDILFGTEYSEWVWQQVRVPDDKGWPPSGVWLSYRFPEPNAVNFGSQIAGISRGGKMDVFWISGPAEPSPSMIFHRNADGGTWNAAHVLPAGMANHTAAVTALSRSPETVEVWWAGLGNSIQHAWLYDGSDWQHEQFAPANAIADGSVMTSVSRKSQAMEVWWIAPDGSIQAAWWYDGSGWTRYTLAPPGSASTAGGLVAVSRVEGHMEVFWVTPRGAIDHAWWFEGATWQTGRLRDDGTVGPQTRLAAVSRRADTMEVFWSHHAVSNAFWYEATGWGFGSIADSGAASPLASAIAVVSRAPDTMELFWGAHDGALNHGWYYEGQNDNRWGWEAVAGSRHLPFISSIAANARHAGTMEVFYGGTETRMEGSYIYFK